jgi:hypothetical protein
MPQDLIVTRLSKALVLLAEARDARDAKEVADLAKAAKVYAERRKLGKEAVDYAHAVEVDALTLLGEFMEKSPKHPPGPAKKDGAVRDRGKKPPDLVQPPPSQNRGWTRTPPRWRGRCEI